MTDTTLGQPRLKHQKQDRSKDSITSTATAFILAGATATGKTAVAQILAEQMGCSILSADAMLVYKGMDIGTAKPTVADRGDIPYAGIDLVTPAEPFSTGRWIESATSVLKAFGQQQPTTGTHTVTPQGKPSLIVVGGTGLYIKALTDGMQSAVAPPGIREKWQLVFDHSGISGLQSELRQRAPEAFASFPDPSNPRRLLRALEQLETMGTLPGQWKTNSASATTVIVLSLPREQLHRRIARRVDQMFQTGFIEEVRALRKAYPVWSATAAKAIGYEEVCALLDNTLTQEAAREKMIIRTRQLAKRQETWFRHQTQAHWLMLTEHDTPHAIAERVYELWRHYGPTTIHIPG
ncbi:MAG: tRNA (adenosine(37)-N6)-dimethylallyltransferase MiaA [bacterium]